MGKNASVVDKKTLSTLIEISKLLGCTVEEAANLLIDRYTDNDKGESPSTEIRLKNNEAKELLEIKETKKSSKIHKVDVNTEYKNEEQFPFWKIIEEEKKKQTIEETHTRKTYLIRNDLLKRLDKLAKKQSKGFKTKCINYALEQFLDKIEEDK